jgi:hypothetical protein
MLKHSKHIKDHTDASTRARQSVEDVEALSKSGSAHPRPRTKIGLITTSITRRTASQSILNRSNASCLSSIQVLISSLASWNPVSTAPFFCSHIVQDAWLYTPPFFVVPRYNDSQVHFSFRIPSRRSNTSRSKSYTMGDTAYPAISTRASSSQKTL